MEVNYLIYFSLFIVGVCKGISDLVQFKFYYSFFNGLTNQFYNPRLSWKNKWKNGDKSNGEKFFGSSRWFVFTTDFWHLVQFFMIKFIFVAVLLPWYFNIDLQWIDCIGILSLYAGFWISYESKLLKM